MKLSVRYGSCRAAVYAIVEQRVVSRRKIGLAVGAVVQKESFRVLTGQQGCDPAAGIQLQSRTLTPCTTLNLRYPGTRCGW